MMNLITFRTTIFYVMCGIVGYFIASGINSLLDRDPPIVYADAHASTSEVEAGKTLLVLLTVDRRRICRTLRVQRFIVDSAKTLHEVSATAINRTRPGLDTYDREIEIPKTAMPGRAEYYVRIEFACSWSHVVFQPIVVESPRVKFTILPAAPT